uniref:60 kDa chaperonin n=1 Tax=Burkholderia sp. MAK1 TaxID=1765374 RepID=A0A2R4K2K4_9BURK|nr:HpdL [Burkholderia sp. MAK1]
MAHDAAHGPVPKTLTFGPDGIRQIASGVKILASAMRRAYGPRRSLVVMARLLDSPLLVSSGWQIAKGFECEGRLPNIGVRLLQEALDDVRASAGDGGTTTAILLDEMLRDGLRCIVAGINPQGLWRGMERATSTALNAIRATAWTLDDDFVVASLLNASGFDVALSRLIQEAVSRVGVTGMIRVIESTKAVCELIVHDGMFFERGLVSNLLATDTTKVEARLHRPYVFVTDRVLASHNDVLGILDQVHAKGGALFIVADDVQGDALSTLISNQLGNVMAVAAIRSPEYGEQRDEVLQDIAVSTGGLVHQQTMHGAVPFECFGRADEIVITRDSTLIIGPHRNELQCAVRLGQVQDDIGPALSQFDQERLQRRVGNLKGGTAELRIGGATDVEMSELQEKAVYLLHAIRTGLKHGVVAGAGSTYVRVAANMTGTPAVNADEQAGVDVVRRALEAPARQLLSNSHIDDLLVDQIIKRYRMVGSDLVYDLDGGGWTNTLAGGLVDPVLALTEPLRVATSMAGLLLNTGAVISDDLMIN